MPNRTNANSDDAADGRPVNESGVPVERRANPPPAGTTVVVQTPDHGGTKTAQAIGAAAAAGAKAATEWGSGGLVGSWKIVGNFTWMLAGMILLFVLYNDKNKQEQARWDYERVERQREREDAVRRDERARDENNKRNEMIVVEMRALATIIQASQTAQAASIQANQEAGKSLTAEFRALTAEFRAVLVELKSFRKEGKKDEP